MPLEANARESIDRLLQAAGWHVCDAAAANIHAARGVAIREFPLPGHGFADYLLYVDGKAAGVIEAKKDVVNVNYDVYRIKTAITEQGSKVEAGYYVEKQERDTRKTRWEELDDDFAYDSIQLDRDVVTPDQIRTIVRTFRDKQFSEQTKSRGVHVSLPNIQ